MPGDMETRVAGLERAMRSGDERAIRMERSIQEMSRILRAATAAGALAKEEDEGARLPGRYWHCAQCNIRLGFQREDTDELRVKYKEFIVVIRPGPASMVKVPCVKCGHDNVIEDARKS
jgi:hypothetical protein